MVEDKVKEVITTFLSDLRVLDLPEDVVIDILKDTLNEMTHESDDSLYLIRKGKVTGRISVDSIHGSADIVGDKCFMAIGMAGLYGLMLRGFTVETKLVSLRTLSSEGESVSTEDNFVISRGEDTLAVQVYTTVEGLRVFLIKKSFAKELEDAVSDLCPMEYNAITV